MNWSSFLRPTSRRRERKNELDRIIDRLEHPGPVIRFVREASRRFLSGRLRKLLPLPAARYLQSVTALSHIYRPPIVPSLSSDDRLLVLVSHELSASGAPKLAFEIARTLVDCGWRIMVLSPQDGPYKERFLEIGATVIVNNRALLRNSPARDLQSFCDAMICNTIVCAHLISHLRPQSIIWYIHETKEIAAFDTPRTPLCELFEKTAQIWASSPMVERHLAPYADKVTMIGAGLAPVHPKMPIRSGNSDMPARFVVLGGIEPRKGQLELAQAYERLSLQNANVMTITLYGRIGDSVYAERVKAVTADIATWQWGGQLSPNEALEAIAAADAVIVPSLDEPLSLVAIEAMGAGKIVVCSRSCGIADYLEDGCSAFVAEAPEPELLHQAMARAIAARVKWPTIGRSAQEIFEREFSLASFTNRVKDSVGLIAPTSPDSDRLQKSTVR